jgi:hypothetical protein
VTSVGLGSVFVLGGTGMLAPATRWIAAHSTRLTLAARAHRALADQLGADSVQVDWTDPVATRASLAGHRGCYDVAVLWLHDDGAPLARAFEDTVRTGGRIVRVHGSASADPQVLRRRDPDPRKDVARQIVILGYHPDDTAPEGRRWLSDAEISGGVIAALRDVALTALTVGGASGD